MATSQFQTERIGRQQTFTNVQAGFTLIEVLVVVAIIALLTAILLPALQYARENARAGVCGSNEAQLLKGIRMHLRSKEKVTTNLGWALPTFKNNSQETGVFTCPSDANPYAVPALFDRYHGDFNGRYHDVTIGSDAVFNRVGYNEANDEWSLKLEDLVQGTEFGFDVDNSSGQFDLLLKYRVHRGDKMTVVRNAGVSAALTHTVLDHKGRTVWPVAQNTVGQTHSFPLLWMSYGANASAGLTTVKGNPVLLVENAKPGVFPEKLQNASSSERYSNDNLAAQGNHGTPLRFRHGGRARDARLSPADYGDAGALLPTAPDRQFISHTSMNIGFGDGHVERKRFDDLIGDPPTVDSNGKLRWHRPFWVGTSKTPVGPSF